MELSINFIVMLILALVVFGMGLTLFRKFFIQAEEIQENLDQQTEAELKQIMMSSPDQVVIYPTKITVKKGRGGVWEKRKRGGEREGWSGMDVMRQLEEWGGVEGKEEEGEDDVNRTCRWYAKIGRASWSERV